MASPNYTRASSAHAFAVTVLAFTSCLTPSVLSQPQSSLFDRSVPGRPCADDGDNFRCSWVGKKNPTRRCRKAATPRTTYADHCPSTCQTCTDWTKDIIHVSNFGAVGDSHSDDTGPIQSAIEYAHGTNATKVGGTVHFGRGVYRTYSPIVVPDGVRLVGEGYGASPLAIKFGGSVLAYCGGEYAVVLAGHNSGLERMAVYDWNYGDDCIDVNAKGGIIVEAVGRLVESVVVRDVLIYHFMNGTSLTLRANNGGIAYGSFYDLRIRHAKIGIHLEATNEGSFVNSNSFYGGAISGTMIKSAVIADKGGPCNDNKFDNMVIEPSSTQDGHVLVRGYKTNVRMIGVRLEGTKQDPLTPMVKISDGSYNNVLDGLIGHTSVRADFNLNPDTKFLTHKGTSVRPNSGNAFHNAAFHGVSYAVDGTVSIPKWTLDGPASASVVLLPPSEEIFPDHRALNVSLSPGAERVKFRPSSSLKLPSIHGSCSFGIYARTSTPKAIVATMRAPSGGMVSSTGHSGSGEWEFIGQAGPYRDASAGGPFPTFYIYGNVELSAPALSFGTVPPAPGFEPISASGGEMTGTLSMGMAVVPPPPEGSLYWELPHEGNLFKMGDMGGRNVSITRINAASGSKRFPVGTVITILLPDVGAVFKHGSYINLKGNDNFVSTLSNSSLTLVSVGSGVWSEVGRNA